MNFFYLSTNYRRNVCTVAADPHQHYNPLALLRGEWTPDKPLQFRHYLGRKPVDVLGATDGISRIISDRLRNLLLENHVTGWSTYSVMVCDKKGQMLPGYAGLSVLGRSGPWDDTQQRIEVRNSPFNPDYQYKVGIGLHFDPNSWDGSDVFTPGVGIILVVERVRALLERERIRELNFIHTDEYEEDLGPA